jgi:hypothetical protein
MKNNIQYSYDRKYYANVRNVASAFFNEKIWNEQDALYDLYLYGNACQQLSDFDGALRAYAKLIEYGYADSKSVRSQIKKANGQKARLSAVKVFCEPPVLRAILENLAYVFNRLDKPIHAFVVGGEDEYKRLCAEKFGQSETRIYPYEGWDAIGIYENPDFHYLLFKNKTVESRTYLPLTGLCAHEIAHLELTDIGIREHFHKFESFTDENTFFNERLTDLYVISKGFGYELYAGRRFAMGNSDFNRQVESRLVMTANEIRNYIEYASEIEG